MAESGKEVCCGIYILYVLILMQVDAIKTMNVCNIYAMSFMIDRITYIVVY